jgi:hypothetical protein
MPLGVAQESNPDDAAALEALRDADETQGGQGDKPTGQQPGSTASTTEGTGGTPASDANEGEAHKGNVNAALRAARRAERRALSEADRLREENERLRKQVPETPAATATDDLSDEELAEIETDFPKIGKLARAVKNLAKAAPAATSAAAPAPSTTDEPEFVPRQLPPELQDVVDGIPDLLGWQNDPDQTAFEMAVAADALLARHPTWKTKPLADRLAEVTRRVQADLGAGASQQANGGIDAVDEAIRNAPTRTPRSPSEIGGAGGREDTTNDLARFSRMSEDDIYAELSLRG